MNGPLGRLARRYLWRHPWQTVLMLVGIVLGVAVMVAIDLANSAASRAFDLSTDAITGRATHQVVGGPRGLDESVYTHLRVEAGVQQAAPVVTDYVTSPQLGERPIQLLGVDPFAEPPFRSYFGQDSAELDVTQLLAFLTKPGALLLSDDLAGEYGLAVGDSVTLQINGRTETAWVAGLLHPTDGLSRRALEGLMLGDISTVQELLGRVGRLDRIDLILPPGDAAVNAVSAALPPDAQVTPVSARTGAIAQMTAAFRLNLTALSMLALVVGMFLIYNSMTFSVVQRRSMFGALRCLGVTRGEIGRMVLVEALVVGVVGSALGVALGVLLGQGAVRLVTQTINDLYFVVTVRGVAIAWTSLLKGFGLATTVATAALPAWEAASVPPQLALKRSGIEETARRLAPRVAVAGVGLALTGGALLAIPTKNLVVSFAGIFAVMFGFALTAPLVTQALMRGAQPVTGRLFGVLGRMAPRQVAGALSRTAVAVAALMVAVSVTIGVGLMVDSFRGTVINWLSQTLYNDIYISAPIVSATRPTAPIDPAVVDAVRAWPGVRSTDVLRAADVTSPQGPIAVTAVCRPDYAAYRQLLLSGQESGAAVEATHQGAILISEPLANRLDLPFSGASLTLNTDRGPHTFPVAGVFRDYSSSQGTVVMGLDLYRQLWDDPLISAVSVELEPGQDADSVAGAMRDALAATQGVVVRANSALRRDVLAVFDRAFAITNALQLLAAVVAFIGVLSALLSLQLERSRELGIMRAVGLTAPQLRGTVLLETGLMGLTSGLLAIPTGFVLSLILIYIINRRSFGWTLDLQVSPSLFLQALALAVIAALLAGIYPSVRMARMLAAEALRGD